MPKQIKRTVDDRLPKWLHSKILSAVDFIWQVKKKVWKKVVKTNKSIDKRDILQMKKCIWVMMFLIIPKT